MNTMPDILNIPAELESKTWFIEKHFSSLEHPLKNAAIQLALVSDYACSQIVLLLQLLAEDSCESLLQRNDYFRALDLLPQQAAQEIYMRMLRQFRNRHFLRLLLLELGGIASTEDIMRSWSHCADALILNTLNYCQLALTRRFGIPRLEDGTVAQLHAVAMGKLGGMELNYSSDIDLIFAFSGAGTTDGTESCSNQQYFSKLVQQFTQMMQQITIDGFVFRVDTRLRPNGDSGPLVSTFAAMETYYQEQGRDWERYAMVKARVIKQSLTEMPSWFAQLITPFVYRRYVDFSVIESLRSMKALIEREVMLNPGLNDIKRGQGGIREIEFIIQNFQLIRGGRLPQLQTQSALGALNVLKAEQLLPRSDALRQAYLFLRKLENALQSLNDKQTHSLPDDVFKQTQICLVMGFKTWPDLCAKLHQYQRIVSNAFNSVLGKAAAYEDEKRVLANQLSSLWQGHIEQNMAINLLISLGYEHADHCYQMIYSFRHGPRCRRLMQGARIRLDRFMVMLLTELAHYDKTEEVLLNVMHLLENIVGRSAYLALLTENPQALNELLFCFAHSPFISSLLVNQPFLLEVLLVQHTDWRPPSKTTLQQLLNQKLEHCTDIESQEELLRQFKLTYWLMAARAELYDVCDALRIGGFLADLAEVIMLHVLKLASQQLSERHSEMKRIESLVTVIAYGKLGSREMNYSSDLDLVFLHQAKPEDDALVNRLTQKILHMLTTRSQSGILYQVDTRLRPSGSAGLLVSRLDAFTDYQKNQAWTWEHQALLRARIISGKPSVKKTLLQLKKAVITHPRDTSTLQNQVREMRAKIQQHQKSDRIKYQTGGLLDVEFLVQFLVLATGLDDFSRHTNTLSMLRHLSLTELITKEQYEILKQAYETYHHLLHRNIVRPGEEVEEHLLQSVTEVCRVLYEPY